MKYTGIWTSCKWKDCVPDFKSSLGRPAEQSLQKPRFTLIVISLFSRKESLDFGAVVIAIVLQKSEQKKGMSSSLSVSKWLLQDFTLNDSICPSCASEQ